MVDESEQFRKRLLEAEPWNREAAERFNEWVAAMWNPKLTRGQRWYWVAGLVASILFAGWGASILIFTKSDSFIRMIWWIYTLANVGFAIVVARMLKKGSFNTERAISLGKLSPGLAFAIAFLLIIRAVGTPTIETLAWALFGMVWFNLASGINLWNRIIKSELTAREQFLRIELLLMERGSKP